MGGSKPQTKKKSRKDFHSAIKEICNTNKLIAILNEFKKLKYVHDINSKVSLRDLFQ